MIICIWAFDCFILTLHNCRLAKFHHSDVISTKQPRTARTNENIEQVQDLVLSQEDSQQTEKYHKK